MDRYQAMLAGFPLEMEDISDTFSKSIARHEFPYRDGALLEDLGQKAREVRIRCYFYEQTYDNHHAFLDSLKTLDLVDFIHPKYGPMKGSIEQVSVRHDDRLRTAEIDITFVENLRSSGDPLVFRDVKSESEDLYEKALDEAQDSFRDGARNLYGADVEDILNRELDPDAGILEQLTAATWSVRGFVKKVDALERALKVDIADVATPAGALISAINFATDLPGRVVGEMARTAARYSTLLSTMKNAPDRFVHSLKDSLETLRQNMFDSRDLDHAAMLPAWLCVAGAETGLQAGEAFALDEEKRRRARKLEGLSRFTATGEYVKTESMPEVMNVRAIESTLAAVNAAILQAVSAARPAHALKGLASLLTEHVGTIKLERENIVPITLDNPMPLHLVCLKYGLPYRAAERILAINRIPNPNFTSGRIDIYAR